MRHPQKKSDRLINNRRPLNAHEGRLFWADLPHGAMLSQLILQPNEVLRAHGADLENYFYSLKHDSKWIHRNCVGKVVDGTDYVDYGGIPTQTYLRFSCRLHGRRKWGGHSTRSTCSGAKEFWSDER